jgi:hypothetical protein
MSERKLLLEIWADFGGGGESLPALIFAGPRGEESRRQLGAKVRLLAKIAAGCHFEAMPNYYRLMGWGEYTTDQPSDYQPYPEEWILEQMQIQEEEA